MSYDCQMLFCIKERICEPKSIRDTLKSATASKNSKILKKLQSFSEFTKNSEKNHFCYGDCIRLPFYIKFF